ncbi:MAG: hypothetical protein Q8P30_02465 [Candidatus Uhrbacteria bacterium]|nr:hypothetical protein [Candidatus Uhrbacteria bacterium]
MLTNREAQILGAIIEEYVESAEPIASGTLVDKYSLDCSPATVRNIMAKLEEMNLLRQPHTSAGRVPTEEGFRLYVQQFLIPKKTSHARVPLTQARAQVSDPRDIVREMAKCLVRLSGETVFSSLDEGWNYYAGISKLFEKPEFSNVDTLRELSLAVDKFDDVMGEVFERVERDINVWIGRENPFGERMSTMLVKYQLPNGKIGILGLVGPLRMDYERNIRLLREAKELLDE